MPKAKLLFVDDRSKRIHSALRKYESSFDVRIAPSAKEALRLMSTEPWDIISLDHDLNGEDFQEESDRTSGMEIVRQIVTHEWPDWFYRKPLFIIHSKNLFAGEKMATILKDCKYAAVYCQYQYDESVIEWLPLCKNQAPV